MCGPIVITSHGYIICNIIGVIISILSHSRVNKGDRSKVKGDRSKVKDKGDRSNVKDER